MKFKNESDKTASAARIMEYNKREVQDIENLINEIVLRRRNLTCNSFKVDFNCDTEEYEFTGYFKFMEYGFSVELSAGDIRAFCRDSIYGIRRAVSSKIHETMDKFNIKEKGFFDEIFDEKCQEPEPMREQPWEAAQPPEAPAPEPIPAGEGGIWEAPIDLRNAHIVPDNRIYLRAPNPIQGLRINLDPDGHAADQQVRAVEREDRAAHRLV